MYNLDNDNLEDFLIQPREEYSRVRWINVNGLSWDVIRLLGNYKGLHSLAIEDLMNLRNRTKADWYSDHTFIILPLQKLVNVEDESDTEDDDDGDDVGDDDDYDTQEINKPDSGFNTNMQSERMRRKREAQERKRRSGPIMALINDIRKPRKKRRQKQQREGQRHGLHPSNSFNKQSKIIAPWSPRHTRSLQRFHAGPNQDRTEFMERHATLAPKGLGVSMEQVSMFLCADGTVISFFEYSAQDVERPIIHRLETTGTILRRACDASMLCQAILDAIIDLAIPVTTAYQDAIGDLELAVLTDPDIPQSTSLYILTSEIAVLRNAIAPISQLLAALKDHKAVTSTISLARDEHRAPDFADEDPNNPMDYRPAARSRKSTTRSIKTGVQISHLTAQYLGDIEDHCVLIQNNYDQMRVSADNLVDLIFNTVSAGQNESMKQLTIVTCFFLPLSFLTGYFGMNFAVFPGALSHSDKFFWAVSNL